ncbi:UDP-N-acetylmuramoyl-L-alanyl-D-glutamate--2,6-diaminopimelate ligase [Granulosicoccaceae sp. 1_MG-2023]|nr:UDP-N-acetylmuramoyl-L-alanyl-D-glutamate--2,6-diaminopimelate ligase [Granulosicoccaceae sp. 1_MG-2023]
MPARKLPVITLSDLLAGFAGSQTLPDLPVEGISLDSRRCRSGYVYFALQGHAVHGLQYAESAVDNGAVAVVADAADAEQVQALQQARPGLVVVLLEKLRQRLGEIAAHYYGNDADAVSMIGVTGTDGKTSVSQFIAYGLHSLGYQSAVVGTNGWGMYGNLQEAALTTPDAITLQEQIAALRKAGATHICMEVSSHALEQYRCSGINFRVVVLTNLSSDHLDYHKTTEAYARAKSTLFHLGRPDAAVINADDDLGQQLLVSSIAANRLISYGASTGATLNLNTFEQAAAGLQLSFTAGDAELHVKTGLIGAFNAENVLAAVGALMGLGLSAADAAKAMQAVPAVTGRMELFTLDNNVTAVVDFAHTAKALESALKAVKGACAGDVWVVFGCGGDRDRSKRPAMTGVAAALADRLVLTTDNPRGEDPQQIFKDMLAGLPEAANAKVIADRAEAISHALQNARSGDVVLIAGKGHEAYQIVGAEKRPFRDQDVVMSSGRVVS